MGSDLILVIVVGTALAFDFTNGFHDTANSIATSVSTRAMSPRMAVVMAAGLNFVGAFLSLYRIEASMDKATEMARILHQSARAVAGAIPRLRTFKDIHHFTVEINRLENDGDRVLREALASLFERGIDPMLVIRWKDIFERLEDAIDATERVANILEGITIKNT